MLDVITIQATNHSLRTTHVLTASRVNCVIFYYRRFDWKILRILDWIRLYAEKLVNALKSHKIVYAPMHTIRVITRLA